MTIAGSGEFIAKIKTAMGSSAGLLESGEFQFAALQALNELEWNYPIDAQKKEFWAIKRGYRHALDILRVQSAHKFQFKQLSLQHRFRHYDALIQSMDEEFNRALDKDPTLWDVSLDKVFGVYEDNGFVYDQYGNDITKILFDLGVDNNGYRYRY
jgi:hypothetical protein